MATEAKVIRVGLDENNLATLPGSSGEISIETSENENTIFGSVFSSTLPGVRDYTFSGNAWFRQTAGFNAKVKRASTPTTLSDVAMSQEDGQTYIVSDISQTPWDFNTSPEIREDDGTGTSVVIDESNIASIDYMFGRVTFVDSFTPTEPVTANVDFLSLTAFGRANDISLTQEADATDNSFFENVQAENGFNNYVPGLKNVSVELSGFYDPSNTFFEDLKNVDQVIVDIDWEGQGETLSRGIFTVQSTSQSGDVGENEEFTTSFSLFVPEDVLPFSWYFGSGTQATKGMQDIINSWINRENLFFEYLPDGDGNKGFNGKMIVTDASISTSVDGIGELTLEGQGNGELVVVNSTP